MTKHEIPRGSKGNPFLRPRRREWVGAAEALIAPMKLWRQQEGATIRGVAARSEAFSHWDLSTWERGIAKPDLSNLMAWASAIGKKLVIVDADVDIDALLEGSNDHHV